MGEASGLLDQVEAGAGNALGIGAAISGRRDPIGGAPQNERRDAYAVEAAGEDATDIPAAIHGRWALVDADCSTTMGDAKGLLLIDGTSLKFYESRAKIGRISTRDDRRLRASFAFSGEGQEWTQEVLLEASEDGKKLVRRDYGPDAMPGALEYNRCPETE